MRKQKPRNVNWAETLKPLFSRYRGRQHPLDYKNRYQLIVLVILSAQSTDDRINELAPALFKAFPSVMELANAEPEELYPYIRSVRGCMKKANWLVSLAREIGNDERIPTTMEGLTALPGIGRKSANVIIRESGGVAEGIITDLHVLRVAPRLGIADETHPEKCERELMKIISPENWNDAGMAFSFLGREICRPTDPKCGECTLNAACAYYASSPKV